MRVLELSLRNYRVFEQIDIELPARVIGIFGPNGAGKSSLVEAIQYALYGTTRTSKDMIRTHGVLTDGEVRLVFEHGGTQYEVRRTIKGKNHTAEAELLAGDLQLAVGVREVTAEVARILHMDHQVFRSSVFAEQKQLDAFSEIRKGERKTMVLRLLGIKPVEDAITAARRESRERTKDAERLGQALPDMTEQEGKVAAAKELLDKAAERAGEAATDLERATEAFGTADEAFTAAEETRRRVEQLAAVRAQAEEAAAGASKRHDDLAARIEQLTEHLAALPSLEAEFAGLSGARDLLDTAKRFADAAAALREAEQELEALPAADPETALAELEAATKDLKAAEKSASKAEHVLDTARTRLTDAEEALATAGELDATEPCPTCGQPLGDAFADVVAHRKKEVAALKKEAAAAQKSSNEADAALTVAEKRHTAAEKDGAAAQRVINQRDVLDKKAAEQRARVEKLGAPFDGALPDLDELAARARRAEDLDRQVTQLTTERKHLDQSQKDLAAAAAERDQAAKGVADLDQQLAKLAFDPKAHAKLKTARDEAKVDLDRAQRDEREAADALKDAEKEVAAAEAGLAQVRAMAAEIEKARDEARYVDRVSMLLGGFRDHLVARIGPELSAEAEALFRELTGHEYEDLRISEEDLSIQIADGGTYHPIERFSGSETDLANLALRVAISIHLSRMSGADIGMMVLDEVLASLDVERKDLMVQAMGRLSERFHQLFVITHAEQVKDAFPASIEVRKVGRRRSEAVLV
ncbi:MAG TPA: SMC family ATPase [Actinomycetota bacterium]|nr:SMC family ATPase [Actinomycetota bacterium]